MKIGFISDIHGNYPALIRVLGELDKMNVRKIFCLGDVVGYYSQVNECCDELKKRNIPCLMGNHDWYLSGEGFCKRSQTVNDCINYQRKIITDENLNWLGAFMLKAKFDEVRMVHGGWSDPIDEYLIEPSEEYFSIIPGKIFVSGHTHIQSLNHFQNKIYCNPGSVGMPRDNDPRAAFATFDGSFYLHRIDYDMEIVFRKMEEAGFNDYYYGCLSTGSKNLRSL